MNPPETPSTFPAAARQLAMEMAANAQYIRKELPRVALPPGLAEILGDACDELISAKFDTIPALSGLDVLRGAGNVAPDVSTGAARILHRLDEAAVCLHPVVMMLQEEVKRDARYQPAFLLVAESAVNSLNAHGEIPRIEMG